MANDKVTATLETALPESAGARPAEPTAAFGALVEWIKEEEAENPSLRIAAISSDDPGAPTSLHLGFSHPIIVKGKPGYIRTDKGFISAPEDLT
jgi:hypothetical protein